MINQINSKKIWRNLLIFMYCAAGSDLLIGIIFGPNYFLIGLALVLLVLSTNISALLIQQQKTISEQFTQVEEI